MQLGGPYLCAASGFNKSVALLQLLKSQERLATGVCVANNVDLNLDAVRAISGPLVPLYINIQVKNTRASSQSDSVLFLCPILAITISSILQTPVLPPSRNGVSQVADLETSPKNPVSPEFSSWQWLNQPDVWTRASCKCTLSYHTQSCELRYLLIQCS